MRTAILIDPDASKLIHTADVQTICKVGTLYAALVCSVWSLDGPSDIYLATDAAKVPVADNLFVFGRFCDDPEDLAYHTKKYGRITSLLGVATVLRQVNATVLHGANSVSATAMHEVAEALRNPYVDQYVSTDSGKRPLELCDAVQDRVFQLQDVSCSDFVYPDYWDPKAPAGAKLDHCSALSVPLGKTDGGYYEIMAADGTVSQVGRTLPHRKYTVRGGMQRKAWAHL